MKPSRSTPAPRRAPEAELALFGFADLRVPAAFEPGAEGARAALLAAAPAIELLTDLHLMCAAQEIAAFFAAHPGVESFQLSSDSNGDDEGRYWTEERFGCSYVDGSDSDGYDSDFDMDERDEQLGGTRQALLEAAESFHARLVSAYPLASGAIASLREVSRASAASLPSAAAKARQEAFLIGREAADPSDGSGSGARMRL